MTEEDIIRLIHRVEGQQEVDAMRAALDKNIETLRNLDRTSENYAQQQATMQATVRRSAADFLRAEEASKRAGNGMAGFGQSMLTAGRSVQDFQAAGLPGILNNIEGMTMALGMGPGLAGALTIAGVAFQIFSKEIKSFWSDLTGGGIRSVDDLSDSLDGLEDQIKELEEKPTKLAIDTQMLDLAKEKLEKLKESAAAFKAIELTTAEEDFGAAMTKLVKETIGGPALARSIKEVGVGPVESETALRRNEQEQEVLRIRMQDKLVIGGDKKMAELQAEADRLRGEVEKERLKKAEDIAGQFGKGEIRETGIVRGMVGRAPGAFAPEFREALADMPSTPGALRKAKELDEELEEFGKATARLGPARDRQRAEAARKEAAAKQQKEREDMAYTREKLGEEREVERRDRERAKAAKAAGIAGIQAVKSAEPAVEATIGGIGMGPVATARAVDRALQKISMGNTTQMDAVMMAVQEVIKTANLMDGNQKTYANNFLRMAQQQRSRRTSPQFRQ